MTFQKRKNYPTDKITPSKTVLFCGPRLSVKKLYDISPDVAMDLELSASKCD